MSRVKVPYKEGDVFAVPIGEQWAAGVVARMDKSGGVLGYFYGPWETPPTAADLARVRPDDALLIGQFGDLYLLDDRKSENRYGRWPVLGPLPGWDRTRWPVPHFARKDDFSGRVTISEYDDKLKWLREWPGTEEDAARLPKDSLMGAGFVERRLQRLLAEKQHRPAA